MCPGTPLECRGRLYEAPGLEGLEAIACHLEASAALHVCTREMLLAIEAALDRGRGESCEASCGTSEPN